VCCWGEEVMDETQFNIVTTFSGIGLFVTALLISLGTLHNLEYFFETGVFTLAMFCLLLCLFGGAYCFEIEFESKRSVVSQ